MNSTYILIDFLIAIPDFEASNNEENFNAGVMF